MKNSKPIMPYKCYICGFYHIGTCFEKGKKIVNFKSGEYVLDRSFKNEESANEYGKKLQINDVMHKIRSYNKPINQKGTFYIYKKV